MDTVRIEVPASPEYVKVARLVAAGLAARLKFTVDEIEDLKIAVDELCAYLTGSQGRGGTIEVEFSIGEDGIAIQGTGKLDAGHRVRSDLTEFSQMILDTVTDSASLEALNGRPTFRITKARKP